MIRIEFTILYWYFSRQFNYNNNNYSNNNNNNKKISKAMVKYASAISLESIIDVLAEITIPEVPIQSG